MITSQRRKEGEERRPEVTSVTVRLSSVSSSSWPSSSSYDHYDDGVHCDRDHHQHHGCDSEERWPEVTSVTVRLSLEFEITAALIVTIIIIIIIIMIMNMTMVVIIIAMWLCSKFDFIIIYLLLIFICNRELN